MYMQIMCCNFTVLGILSIMTITIIVWTLLGKCVEKFTNMKKWPMSIPTFELLATVHDQKVVEIDTKFVELTWHRILARMLLCSNDGQSYFWKKSAGVLLSTFIIKVIKTKVFKDFLGLNYMQTINLHYLLDTLLVYVWQFCLHWIIKKRTIFSRSIVFHQKGWFFKNWKIPTNFIWNYNPIADFCFTNQNLINFAIY